MEIMQSIRAWIKQKEEELIGHRLKMKKQIIILKTRKERKSWQEQSTCGSLYNETYPQNRQSLDSQHAETN